MQLNQFSILHLLSHSTDTQCVVGVRDDHSALDKQQQEGDVHMTDNPACVETSEDYCYIYI